jgi:hypothetical protein
MPQDCSIQVPSITRSRIYAVYHDINEAILNLVKKEIGTKDIPLRFLLKYIFENKSTKRLIFLYVSIIDDEEKFNCLELKDGKLWTEKQIEENRNSNIFSECFELEFVYLKNTVLLNYKLKATENTLLNAAACLNLS